MKNQKIIPILIIAAVSIVILGASQLLFKDNIPNKVESITIVDTSDYDKSIEITGADADRIVELTRKCTKNRFDIPACPMSNIKICYNTNKGEQGKIYRCISADECATLWGVNNSSYSISQKDFNELKQIITIYGFCIYAQ